MAINSLSTFYHFYWKWWLCPFFYCEY